MATSEFSIAAQMEEARLYFAHTQYGYIVREADQCLQRGQEESCLAHLNRLPSAKVLLAELVSKLKGKSVYKTLERAKQKNQSGLLELKALSSLLTHAVIECEQGQLQYRTLIPLLLEKINDVGFGILSRGEEQ